MTNIMSKVRFSNKPSRNAFDLSRKLAFSSKAGELLPIYCEEVLPGDKFRINPQWFTRTEPLNTAAYTRLTEYVDFYYVPTRLLWRYADSFFAQTNDSTSALSITDGGLKSPSEHPFFRLSEVIELLSHRIKAFEDPADPYFNYSMNMFGFNRGVQSLKLLEYLGYGHMADYFSSDYTPNVPLEFKLNPFPLLAYQCIYQYFERFDAWEDKRTDFYNIDYMSTDHTDIAIHGKLESSLDDMFDLRYANWKRDLFTGLLPNAQYGDEATASIISSSSSTRFNLVKTNGQYLSPSTERYLSPNGTNGVLVRTSVDNSIVESLPNITFPDGLNLPIIALRQAEVLQRYKEIKQSNKYDYKSQIEAIWNVNVSRERAMMPIRIGGISNSLNIDEVVNTSITDSGDERQAANIAGKGSGAGSGFVDFDVKDNGYIIGIYKVCPELDYVLSGIPRTFQKTYAEDYANPLFDKLGMESVKLPELLSSKLMSLIDDLDNGIANLSLGYAPRYYEYKTAIDRVVGSLATQYQDTWVAPYNNDYILRQMRLAYDNSNYLLNYGFFKINPTLLNPIFVSQIGLHQFGNALISDYSNEQFKTNMFFDVKVVRNLDYNGLPY